MTKTRLKKKWGNWKVISGGVVLVIVFSLLGLNYQQLYSAWAVRSEIKRLTRLAAKAPDEFQNPAPMEDKFGGKLSSDFWKFTVINGGGKASNELAWHSGSIVFDHSLTINHIADPFFQAETPDWHMPAADQYNNVSLIGGSGFRPSPSRDVVLKFTTQVSEGFYGSAGVVFQPVGTLQKDGSFPKPFDMFGFAVADKESSVIGVNGPLCYLALNLFPVQTKPLQVDVQSLHSYEIRLHWNDRTEWLGILKVDGVTQCQMRLPAFGPVEVHVWSDNALVRYQARRWWEIAPEIDFGYGDGGDKQFDVGWIRIFADKR